MNDDNVLDAQVVGFYPAERVRQDGCCRSISYSSITVESDRQLFFDELQHRYAEQYIFIKAYNGDIFTDP